jgi:hypothetical protein
MQQRLLRIRVSALQIEMITKIAIFVEAAGFDASNQLSRSSPAVVSARRAASALLNTDRLSGATHAKW